MSLSRSLAAAAVTVATVFCAEAQAGHGGKVEFTQEIEAGFQQARRTGKPIMIYFTAEW